MSDRDNNGTRRVVIVQCTNTKRDEPAKARRLYDPSSYFRAQRDYAKAVADIWFIQSAKYGLVAPNTLLEPYDMHAGDLENPEAWAATIATTLKTVARPPATVEILGGKDYADPLTPELERFGYEVVEPLRGQMIGERKSSLNEMANQKLEGFA